MIELAGPNLDSAQETWHRVGRRAAVLDCSQAVFPEMRHLRRSHRHFILWYERREVSIAGLDMPGSHLLAVFGDQDGVYPNRRLQVPRVDERGRRVGPGAWALGLRRRGVRAARRQPRRGPAGRRRRAFRRATGGRRVQAPARRRREARDAALADFERLGATAWAARTRAELAHIGGRAPARRGLTDAERRIAEQVAAALRNKEVAATLYPSVSTVEAAPWKIYRKLDVRFRTQLAARLAEIPPADLTNS